MEASIGPWAELRARYSSYTRERRPVSQSFAPAFHFALRPAWAVYYAIYAAAALIVTGLLAFFTTQPAWGVFTFPNNHRDAVFHVATGVLLAAVAAIQLGIDRRAGP